MVNFCCSSATLLSDAAAVRVNQALKMFILALKMFILALKMFILALKMFILIICED
jgi:hypothetical protein